MTIKKDDKILELFKKNKESFLSGEEVSQMLGISRQALWKHIEKFREIGYKIEAVPHLGYKLLEVPEKILVSEIKWNLKTKIIGKEIHYYKSLGSTNDIAYDLGRTGAGEGTLVIANEQTKGRGRLGRRWESPEKGGIYLSCILRPRALPTEIPKITLAAAVAVVKAINEFCGLKALIRWPNDILISDRKAGGILTELKAEMDRTNFVILGIGINLNTKKKALPAAGTSLKEESKSSRDFSRIDFIKTLLRALEREYYSFKEKKFSAIRSDIKSFSCTLGRMVNVMQADKTKFHGKAVDIDLNGALVVKLSSGLRKTFLSGDVTFIR